MSPPVRSDPLAAATPLVLVAQARIADALGVRRRTRLEASGVLAHDGRLYVIFDNTAEVAVLPADPAGLTRPGCGHLVALGDVPLGYEDIARDPLTGHHYLVIEARRRGHGWAAWIDEFSPGFTHRGGGWVDVPLPSENKGVEGLTCVQRDGETFLLAMAEGNFDAAGPAGQRPGGGRVHVLRRRGQDWTPVSVIALPAWLPFTDYSSLSVRDDRITVVSQESSAVWVGRLRPGGWEVDDTVPGDLYVFPRDAEGRRLYRSVEGVSWTGPRQLAVVSDRRKGGDRTGDTEEAVHLFDLPAPP